MFTTTLRIPDELALFLQDAAQRASLSVNAFLAQLLERERAEAQRRRLAQDWTAYAAEDSSQDVGYALAAQGELVASRAEMVAEDTVPYRSPAPAAKPRKGRRPRTSPKAGQ